MQRGKVNVENHNFCVSNLYRGPCLQGKVWGQTGHIISGRIRTQLGLKFWTKFLENVFVGMVSWKHALMFWHIIGII